MSIRPIDMQVTIQKTDHFVKDYNQNSQALNSQQGISVETQRQVLQQQRQVVSTQSTKNKRIDRDGSNKSKANDYFSNNKKNHGQQKTNKDKALFTEDDKGTFVDITI